MLTKIFHSEWDTKWRSIYNTFIYLNNTNIHRTKKHNNSIVSIAINKNKHKMDHTNQHHLKEWISQTRTFLIVCYLVHILQFLITRSVSLYLSRCMFYEKQNSLNNNAKVLEEKVVQTRAKELQQLINDQTEHVNNQLMIFQDIKQEEKMKYEFKYEINDDEMKKFLSYIHEWNGLTSSAKIPQSQKQYENKARNWLNGRRAKQYGNSLFEHMINHCIKVKNRNYSLHIFRCRVE